MTERSFLSQTIEACRACPRLVDWRERVAREKVARFRDQEYWGRPVSGFGDPEARLLIVGLAPGAHGANRTGRVFTGDRSGDFLFAALHRAGLATRVTSRSREDGLALRSVYIVTAIRCAPPANKPAPDEIARCAHFLDQEIALLPRVRSALALGAIAWRAVLDHCVRVGADLPRPLPSFAHGRVLPLGARASPHTCGPDGPRVLLGSYHVSQQNTQTGRLTEAMFDAVIRVAMSHSNLR